MSEGRPNPGAKPAAAPASTQTAKSSPLSMSSSHAQMLPPTNLSATSNSNATLSPSRLSSLKDRRARQARNLWLTIGVSTALHLFFVAGYAFWPGAKKPTIDLDQAVVKARLVKLGKPRDEKMLPRIPTAPPPTPVEKKAAPTITPPTAPDKETIEPEKKSASDILNKFKNENVKPKDLNDLIKDKIGEQDDEGQEFGDKEGTALDGEITDSYFARVTARIQTQMEVSSVLTDEERVRLKAVLCLKIGDSGDVTDITVKTSGSAVFDSDVTAAARKASPVPAPPPPARDRSAEGVCFNFCPAKCN